MRQNESPCRFDRTVPEQRALAMHDAAAAGQPAPPAHRLDKDRPAPALRREAERLHAERWDGMS